MRKALLSAIILCCCALTKAQVKGIVIDSADKKPIDKAVIGLVIKSSPADTIYTFTDEKGAFKFNTVPASNFSVVITNSGFQPIAKFVPVNKQESSVDIGTVQLASRGKLLEEVVVEAPAIVIKEDTVEYRADAFKTKEGAVVEDLLKKLPGVQVDKDGNIKAQGKNITKVKVNGKDFFGGDVQTATKELPANIVDKIQVIDDYGDQATVSGIKDGDPTKTLNITIKKDKNKGFFGRATVGGGTNDRYQASFNGNYFNNNQQISLFASSNNVNQSLFNFGSFGGNRGMGSMIRMGQGMISDMGGMSSVSNAINNGDQSFISNSTNNSGVTTANSVGFNYRDQWGKRVSVYGSYSYSHRNNNALTYTAQQNFYNDTTFLNNQNDNSRTIGDNHRLYFNMEYQVDSFNYIKFSPSFSYSTNDGNSQSAFDYSRVGGGKTSDGSNANITNTTTPNVSGTILYNHKFRKKGRNFSANLSLGTSKSNTDQDAQNITNTYVLPIGTYNQFQFINQDNNNYNYGMRFTYSEPLSKTRNLDLSYSHNLNYARNDKQTYSVDPLTGNQTFVGYLSNDYENNYYNNRAGISVRTVKKKYNYTVGLSLQPVDLQGKSLTKDSAYSPIKRVNIFPIARFAYNFSRSKTFNFTYNGNATQPTFSQLQDVLDVSNQQYATRGNPNLKSAMNHNLNFSYNNFNFISGKVLFTNLSFNTIQNQIVNNNIRTGNTGAQLSVPENVNGYYNVMGFYTFSKPYKNRKYVITFNGTANYNHNINLVDSARTIGKNWVVSQGFNFEFNYKEWLQFGSGINYSLNDVKYKAPNNDTATAALQNTSSNAWTISSNINMDITKRLTLKYDLDYTINNGISSSVSKNVALMNASIEQQLFKKKNGILKLAVYDLFNQNTNINRSVSANSIIDTRTNRLTRYCLLSFTYRIQKFKGQGQPGMPMPGGRQVRIGF